MKTATTILTALACVLVLGCSREQDQTPSFAPPTGLTAEAAGVTSVRLTWENASTDYWGTIIERSFSGGDFSTVGTVGTGVTTYLDKTVSEEGDYTYRLYAFNETLRTEPAEVTISFVKTLPAPSGLAYEKTSEGLVLTWTDNCEGEEGYVVTRQVGGGSVETWQYLAANTETVTDTEAGIGSYTYTVMAYYGTLRSEAATVTYENYIAAEISISKVETSWYMASATLDLTSDGGEECEVGLCWSATGTPTKDDGCYTYPSKVSASDYCFGNATGLDYGTTYNLRAWATNNAGTAYSSVVTAKLEDAPTALSPTWTQVTDYSFPDEVKLYKTTTTVTGSTINAWYAIADLSTGNVELRTTKASSLTTPTNFITGSMSDETVYVTVNGGYFDSVPQSYSYVRDRGSLLASNLKSLTRSSKSYYVTRGALGVDENQNPSMYWIYLDGSTTIAYDTPLPVVEGGDVLYPTRTYPTTAIEWDNYSGIGGAPILLRDGRICFDYLTTSSSSIYKSNYELLQSDIFASGLKNPRTAIGYTPEGKVVLMVVDGRNSGGSAGVTLEDLARLMMGVGCENVLNLDGGGSTMMCVTSGGTLLNTPSDGGERAILSYVSFVKKK